ncbi:MAG TPA: BadF/BadG/BcrA/BcrD ATPase family protein, partial [Clostridium sp.]
MNKLLKIGIDIGSTTIKMVVVSGHENVIYKTYRRHLSDIRNALRGCLEDAKELIEDSKLTFSISGSGGMSLAEKLNVEFVQEVIASTKAIQKHNPDTDVVIELGGEDAKITYLNGGVEQRMNGTCAGGTGAFIDQMASLSKNLTALDKGLRFVNNEYCYPPIDYVGQIVEALESGK